MQQEKEDDGFLGFFQPKMGFIYYWTIEPWWAYGFWVSTHFSRIFSYLWERLKHDLLHLMIESNTSTRHVHKYILQYDTERTLKKHDIMQPYSDWLSALKAYVKWDPLWLRFRLFRWFFSSGFREAPRCFGTCLLCHPRGWHRGDLGWCSLWRGLPDGTTSLGRCVPWMIRLETKVDDGVLCWQLGDEETVRMARWCALKGILKKFWKGVMVGVLWSMLNMKKNTMISTFGEVSLYLQEYIIFDIVHVLV